MYLYDTPRDIMAKYLMLQSLCSTPTWKALGIMPNTSNNIFMCSRASLSTQIIDHSCAPEFLTQQNSSITNVLQCSLLNTHHQSLMCSKAPCSTQIINHSCALQLLSQHKSSITRVLQSFPLNTKHLINHVLQGPRPTQTSIQISSIIGSRPIYKKIIMFICSGVFDPIYQNKNSR